MKVTYYIGALNRGGLETLILDVCRKHALIPYTVVCMYRHDGNITEEFEKSGVRLIHVPKNKGIVMHCLRLRHIIQEEDISLIHSQSAVGTLFLSLATMGMNVKIITSFHGHLFADAPKWQRKLVYGVSEKILCVSEYQKRYYEEKWILPKDNKLEVVYNGIDFTKIDGVMNERVRELESESVKLAMVGNFVKGRSPMVVVKALERLDAMRLEPKALDAVHLEIPDYDFYFIGRRDEKEAWRYDECVEYCKQHSLQNVHFLGSRNDVPAILKSIDGFVYSTAHDTFGIAVIEAIAAGLPIVVNDWPVMTEVCGEENAGMRYFKTEDINDAAHKIALMLSNLEESKIAAKENAKFIREKYSIEQHINQLNRIYQSVL